MGVGASLGARPPHPGPPPRWGEGAVVGPPKSEISRPMVQWRWALSRRTGDVYYFSRNCFGDDLPGIHRSGRSIWRHGSDGAARFVAADGDGHCAPGAHLLSGDCSVSDAAL